MALLQGKYSEAIGLPMRGYVCCCPWNGTVSWIVEDYLHSVMSLVILLGYCVTCVRLVVSWR